MYTHNWHTYKQHVHVYRLQALAGVLVPTCFSSLHVTSLHFSSLHFISSAPCICSLHLPIAFNHRFFANLLRRVPATNGLCSSRTFQVLCHRQREGESFYPGGRLGGYPRPPQTTAPPHGTHQDFNFNEFQLCM